jgi:hypothetical protein
MVELGDVFLSTKAIRACHQAGEDWKLLIRRHADGDFGQAGRLAEIEVTPEEVRGGCLVTDADAKLNKVSVVRGRGRVQSIYQTCRGDDVWLVTDFDGEGFRETTMMLDEEY